MDAANTRAMCISLSHALKGAAVCIGIAAAWFEFRDRAQNDDDRKKTKEWYGRKWTAIRDSRLLDLPQMIVHWLLTATHAAATRIGDRFGATIQEWAEIKGPQVLVMFLITMALLDPKAPNVYRALCAQWNEVRTPGMLTVLAFFLWLLGRWLRRGTTFFYFVCMTWWGYFIVKLSALSAALLFAPLPLVVLAYSVYMFSKYEDVPAGAEEDRFTIRVLFFAISFPLTLAALAVGSFFAPHAPLPIALQLLISNVLCDTATIWITLTMMGRATRPDAQMRMWFAIPMTIILGGVLACASLWCGLAFSPYAISMSDVFNVLIGLNPAGTRFEFGPYFWTMHTTFLPTLLFLSLVCVCYLGKLCVLPVAGLFRKGSSVDKPHHLTAGLFTLIAAICLGLATLLENV